MQVKSRISCKTYLNKYEKYLSVICKLFFYVGRKKCFCFTCKYYNHKFTLLIVQCCHLLRILEYFFPDLTLVRSFIFTFGSDDMHECADEQSIRKWHARRDKHELLHPCQRENFLRSVIFLGGNICELIFLLHAIIFESATLQHNADTHKHNADAESLEEGVIFSPIETFVIHVSKSCCVCLNIHAK